MQRSDRVPLSDEAPFGAIVRSHAWDWLLALRRRLNVDLQLVDKDYAPLLSPATSAGTIDIRHELGSGAPSLRGALSAAMQMRSPHAATMGDVLVVCFGITTGRHARGALVLARRVADSGETPELARAELEIIGVWLCGAVEAHLASIAVTPADDHGRFASLARLLSAAGASGSDRDFVRCLADALAVWHDIELCAYVETDHGTFEAEVWLPGADFSKVPVMIQVAAVPDVQDVVRLARADADRIGVALDMEILTARIAVPESGSSWLLLMRSPVAAQNLRVLSVYVTFLSQAIDHAVASAAARVVTAVAQGVLEDDEHAEDAVHRVLADLHRVFAARAMELSVIASNGVSLAQIGIGDDAGADDRAVAERLTAVRRIPREYSMVLSVLPGDRCNVTPQDRYVLRSLVDALGSWARRLARRAPAIGDRRAASHRFDDVMERFADQAIGGGAAVTVLVVVVADSLFRPGALQRWIATVRSHLRASDLVGMLADGGIGVLLHETGGGEAQRVVLRVQQLWEAEFGSLLTMSLGLASRMPGEPATGGVVQEARVRASERRDTPA